MSSSSRGGRVASSSSSGSNTNNNDLKFSTHNYEAIPASTMHQLIYSYLTHHCYKDTAQSFMKEIGVEYDTSTLLSIDLRKEILGHIKTSVESLKQAMSLIFQHFPTLLPSHPYLYFHFHCQIFIEYVRVEKLLDAIEYAQVHIAPLTQSNSTFKDEFEDVAALVAYYQPTQSPMGYLMSSDRLNKLDSDLNQIMAAYRNLDSSNSENSSERVGEGVNGLPPLDKVIRQLTRVSDELHTLDKSKKFPKWNLSQEIENLESEKKKGASVTSSTTSPQIATDKTE